MATLSTDQRNDMPKKEFGIPSERRFPINDKAHARNALARLNQAKGLTHEEKVHIMRMANEKLRGKER
jgi:hypothetical protein